MSDLFTDAQVQEIRRIVAEYGVTGGPSGSAGVHLNANVNAEEFDAAVEKTRKIARKTYDPRFYRYTR